MRFIMLLQKEGHPGGPEPPPSVELFEAWLRTVRGPVGWGVMDDGSFEVHWLPGAPIPCLPRAVRDGNLELPIVVRVTTRAVLHGAGEESSGSALAGALAAAGFAVVTGLFFALTSDKPPAREAWWQREQRGLPPPI